MIAASLTVETDWTARNFDEGAGQIQRFVRDYSITRGRSSELDRVGAGQAVITVDSPSALFSPLNTSGSLSGSLLPGRSIKIAWAIPAFGMKITSGVATDEDDFIVSRADGDGIGPGGSAKYYRFVGKIKSYSSEPDVSGQRNATLTCIDYFNELQRHETRSTLYQTAKSGCLAGSLLNDAGFYTACRVIADGQDIYKYAFFEKRKLDEVLVDIERTEYGFMYVRGDGAFVFHDRHYRSTTPTVTASFIDTMSGITYFRSDDDLATAAEVSFRPKIQKGNTTVWTLQSPISINAKANASFFGAYIDPTTCQLTPALGIASGTANFFTASDGTGTNVGTDFSTSFVAFAESFKFAASNAGSTTNWLSSFTVTGCPLTSYENSTARAVDAAACKLYGLRTLTYGGQNLIHTSEKARDFARFLVNRFKDPANLDDTALTLVNDNSTNLRLMLLLELDDRIALSNTILNMSGVDFFIGKLDERWSTDQRFNVTYQLERASTQNDFIVDSSDVGSGDGLGY